MQHPRNEAEVRVSRIVGKNVRRLRTARSLTGRALASKIQADGYRLAHSSLIRIEGDGFKPVTVDELLWLAEALGVPPAVLLSAPGCQACFDAPPPGFACTSCKATA